MGVSRPGSRGGPEASGSTAGVPGDGLGAGDWILGIGCGGGGAAGGCGGRAHATLGAGGLGADGPLPPAGRPKGGGAAAVAGTGLVGTCTTVLHCGHEARLPAAAAGTFKLRPQPVQENSMESEIMGEVMRAGECQRTKSE